MPTVLLVNYAFPPFGGAASRRVLKLVKHLHPLGWRSVVVTSRRIPAAIHDPSLLAEVPPGSVVVRTPTLDPIPTRETDQARALLRRALNVPLVTGVGSLWAVAAIPMALAAVRRFRPQAVVCSAPDFASFLIGAAVKSRFDLPLVLDYRDEWTFSPIKARSLHGAPLKNLKCALERRIEARLCAYADHINVVSPAYIPPMQAAFRLDPRRFSAISNGYDETELGGPGDLAADWSDPAGGPRPFRLALLGGLAAQTLRSTLPPALLRAVADAAQHAGRPGQIHVLGRVAAPLRQELAGWESSALQIVFHGYLQPRRAMALARSADLRLLLGYDDIPGAERCYPLKLFDYLGLRRPILVVGPRQGVMAELALQSGLAEVFEHEDHAGLLDYLVRAFDGQVRCTPHEAVIGAYGWSVLAARWSRLLEDLSTSPPARQDLR